MARIHGADGRVYVDQYNLSGRANSWEANLAQPSSEVTAFEDTAETFVVGIGRRGWTGSVSAFSDYTATEIDEVMHAIINDSDHAIGLYANGAAAGSAGYEGIGSIRRKGNTSPQAGAAMLNLDFQGRSLALASAHKLNEATAITATGNQTGQLHRLGATVAADRILCVIRITAVSGAGSVTFKLQESSDDGGGDPYADVMTMTAMTAVGFQTKSQVAAGVLGPYYRINVSAFSGFTSVTLRASVGIIKGG